MAILVKRSLLLFVSLLFCWGSYAAVVRILLSHIDFYLFSFYSFGFALVTLILVQFFRKKKDKNQKAPDKLSHVILAGVLCYLYYATYGFAILKIGSVQASIINYSFPLWIILFSSVWNRKWPKVISVLSVCIGFAGVLLALSQGVLHAQLGLASLSGILLAFAAAICWGLFSTLGGRFQGDPIRLCLIYTLVCFMLSGLAIVSFSSLVIVDFMTLLGLAWVGIFATAIPYVIWFHLIKTDGIEKMAVLSFLTPFATLLFIFLLIGEKISLYHVIGLTLIVASCLLHSSKTRTQSCKDP